MERAGTFTAPLRGAREGALDVRRAKHLTVRAAAMDALCRGAFVGWTPKARAADGRVTIEYPRPAFAWFPGRPRRVEIDLNAALAWSLAVRGGVRDATLDLGGLEVRTLDLHGGAADVRVVLPAPYGRVRVTVRGGASNVAFLRPAGVAATLRIGGGASRLTFDEERYGAVGGETRLETSDAGSAADRYELEITGGASRLVVAELDAGGR